jgi:hypothetical protein
MATGPDHYQRAEYLLEAAEQTRLEAMERPQTLVEAQVHATLALAAATALDTGLRDYQAQEWVEAAIKSGHTPEPPAAAEPKPAGEAAELAAGLRAIAGMVETATGDLLDCYRHAFRHLSLPAHHYSDPDALLTAARADVLAAGGGSKDHNSKGYVGYDLQLGPVTIWAYKPMPDDPADDAPAGGA